MVLDNVSWGELFIIVGVGISLVGRKDLPAASKYLGRQVGRVVGLLVGGRQRLEVYTSNNELSKLQNELRMGLRELDAIKTEMALASSVGMRQLGVSKTGGSATHNVSNLPPGSHISSSRSTSSIINPASTTSLGTMPSISNDIPTTATSSTGTPEVISTPSLSMRAIAEDEWNKRGIGFKSRAEQGTTTSTIWTHSANSNSTNATFPEPSRNRALPPTITVGGAAVLAELIQNNLIYDQYDRVLQERDEILRPKPPTNNSDLTKDADNEN